MSWFGWALVLFYLFTGVVSHCFKVVVVVVLFSLYAWLQLH